MLPQNHFLVAGLTISPAAFAFFPEKTIAEIGEWVLIGGLASAVIDADILALVLWKSKKERRLRLFRNPIEIFRRFKLFMDTITDTGVLKTGLQTHLIVSLLIILACYSFADAYMVPVALGVASHIASDLRYLRRLV